MPITVLQKRMTKLLECPIPRSDDVRRFDKLVPLLKITLSPALVAMMRRTSVT